MDFKSGDYVYYQKGKNSYLGIVLDVNHQRFRVKIDYNFVDRDMISWVNASSLSHQHEYN